MDNSLWFSSIELITSFFLRAIPSLFFCLQLCEPYLTVIAVPLLTETKKETRPLSLRQRVRGVATGAQNSRDFRSISAPDLASTGISDLVDLLTTTAVSIVILGSETSSLHQFGDAESNILDLHLAAERLRMCESEDTRGSFLVEIPQDETALIDPPESVRETPADHQCEDDDDDAIPGHYTVSPFPKLPDDNSTLTEKNNRVKRDCCQTRCCQTRCLTERFFLCTIRRI